MALNIGGDAHYIPPNAKVFTSKSPKVKYHLILSLFQKTKTYRIKTYIGDDNKYDEKVIESKPCHIKWNDTDVAYLNKERLVNGTSGKYTLEELSLDKNKNLVSKLIATNKPEQK